MDFSDRYHKLKEITENLDDYDLDTLEKLLKDAQDAKSEYENLQLVAKRNANSLYGVSASVYFSLCDFDIAEDITMTGKHFTVIVDRAINNIFVNWGESELKIIQEFYPQVVKLRKFVQYVPDTPEDICVYGDTDSRYIDIGKIYSFMLLENGKSLPIPESDKELADFVSFLDEKFFRSVIKTTIDNDCEFRNARKGFLKMDHEVTARKCIFRAKKQYIMTTIWEDGLLLDKPKLKFKGVELKKGGTSPKAKKILSKLVDKYLLEGFNNDALRLECLKLIKYIKTKKAKDFLYMISSVSGLKEIFVDDDGIYKSNKHHIQMQMAVSWLNFIKDNNLQEQYFPPFEGQKMAYYYCDENSPYKVIAIPDDVDINKVPNLPEPDWNRMINATLIKPLLRYIYDKDEINDVDIEHFLLGVKAWNF